MSSVDSLEIPEITCRAKESQRKADSIEEIKEND